MTLEHPTPGTQAVDPSHGFVLRHRKAILFLVLALCLAGAYSAYIMPASVFPQTDFPRVVILIDNGVMPADEMMATITRPVEEAMNNIPGTAIYEWVVRRALRHRWAALASTAIVIVAGVLLYDRLETDFLPKLEEGAFVLDYYSRPGTSLSETNRMLRHSVRGSATRWLISSEWTVLR